MDNFLKEKMNKYLIICKSCCKCKYNKPISFWDCLPEGCKLIGHFFLEREKIKQQVRKKKELIIELESSLKNQNDKKDKSIENKITKLNSEIGKYSDLGSFDW